MKRIYILDKSFIDTNTIPISGLFSFNQTEKASYATTHISNIEF